MNVKLFININILLAQSTQSLASLTYLNNKIGHGG